MERPEHMRDDTMRLLESLVRTGRVDSVNAKRHTAKVKFEDDGDDAISHDLQVLVNRGGDNWLPAPQTLVVCLLLPSAAGDGFVLGPIYSEADAPPVEDAAVRVIASEDLRLGSHEATDFVALASKVEADLNKIKAHIEALEQVLNTPVNEPGNGAPSAFQAAIGVFLASPTNAYPDTDAVGASLVKAK